MRVIRPFFEPAFLAVIVLPMLSALLQGAAREVTLAMAWAVGATSVLSGIGALATALNEGRRTWCCPQLKV
ncbi:hypothetical protein EAH89_21485 [Roseomonas nepalensis]|uniref:Uncharacterized protein n=1 Tax=Muricoccus nepalensis TaxID=1854500 RepID=A0A502FIL9_9PROT|nr:hypothetical protein EAH89_21485 [Roseomonas nepalensis]